MEALDEMSRRGWIEKSSSIRSANLSISKGRQNVGQQDEYQKSMLGDGAMQGRYFVRRLRHLQHICQRFQVRLSSSGVTKDAIQYLLMSIHPTPAVGGYPTRSALDFIRKYESTGFDRGFYSGPLGYVGREEAEIVVAIRSGLVSREVDTMYASNGNIDRPKVSVYAGGKFDETSFIFSCFHCFM
jgi:hypothetical protein